MTSTAPKVDQEAGSGHFEGIAIKIRIQWKTEIGKHQQNDIRNHNLARFLQGPKKSQIMGTSLFTAAQSKKMIGRNKINRQI